MPKSVAPLGAADDGETMGQLKRPSGGFRVASGYQISPAIGQISPEERHPCGTEELWLVPSGPPQPTEWLRDSPERPRSGLLRQFAGLHGQSDKVVTRFASRHGWLNAGTLIFPDPSDLSVGPVWGDRLRTWRRESSALAELCKIADDAVRLRRYNSEDARRSVLAHFQSSGETLWVGTGKEQLRRATGQTEGWRVVPIEEISWRKPEGARYENALAFTYAGGAIFLPFPGIGERSFSAGGHGRGAPTWGSDLARADGSALAELAMYALGCVAQTVLRSETHATLTLRKGIRVAPSSLLGALYLNFARDLIFERRGHRLCRACGTAFTPRRKDQRWCSGTACRSRARRLGISSPGSPKVRAAAAQRRTVHAASPA
ncbi:MAG: hypothetical protein ACRENX_07485 [Candidatus Dormibacteria bacterium]